MAQLSTLERRRIKMREIIPFPRVDEFYGLLQDRLHMTVEGFSLEHQFTLLINTLPRKKLTFINRFENVPLIYAGIPRQRELLEGPKGQWKPHLDEHWNFLDVTDLNSDTAVVSSQLFNEFSKGNYKLIDIPRVGMGRLEDYFEPILYPTTSKRKPTPRQVAEFHILKEYFDIFRDQYLSLPLIQFGEFDGIIHLVYTRQDEKNITTRTIINLIKSYSVLYENLVLDWDLVSRNPEKSEAIKLPLNNIFYEEINRNPILRELGYDKYYAKHLPYLQERIRLNDKVIHSKVYSPYLKAAIISIMIDSYAHNVSAHSLVALNWWFKRRAENIRSETNGHQQEVEEVVELIEEYIPKGYEADRVIELLQPWIEGHFVKEQKADFDVVKHPGSLAREVQPLLKFLMEKGAFWSGISRDNHFGGEASSLFSVLWEDFINNPLYLGTIAKSEDIHKISIHITFYGLDDSDEQFHSSFHRPKQVLMKGTFVEIDIKNKRPKAKKDNEKGYYIELHDGTHLYYADHKELESLSNFVYPGKDFLAVKKALSQCQLFFPGEVVGRHSFFTMLENEIRNVKHYKGGDLKKIQENGLQLNIAIQEASVKTGLDREKELYKIGVWIGMPTDLVLKNKQFLVQRRFKTLITDVMDGETFAPRLGGSFQDKICAGMLFNNKFGKVQNGDGNPARDLTFDTLRDEAYYPWIIPATSPEHAPHDDIELHKHLMAKPEKLEKIYNHRRGYFKKYFYIWKASSIKTVTGLEDTNFIWENLSRFKFVALHSEPYEKAELWRKVRKNGVIRIIEREELVVREMNEAIITAYNQWLELWLGVKNYAINLTIDEIVIGRLLFKDGVFSYFNSSNLSKEKSNTKKKKAEIEETIQLAHGGQSIDPKILRYRNHGIYKTYFMPSFEEEKSQNEAINRARLAELLEVFTTRICIFDNRVSHRVKNSDREEMYRNVLKVDIFGEDAPVLNDKGEWEGIWEDKKKELIPNTHFLVLHLSYIEKILLTKYSEHEDFEEENIGLFIENEILPLVQKDGEVRDNFILVITSGRGRTKWWAKLNEKRVYNYYTTFTVFRPVESIISGIEDALRRKDDIELKYNLVKVLFGT